MARARQAWPESRPTGEGDAPRGRSAARTAARILDLLLGPLGPRDFAVRLWDGTTPAPEAGREARFTLVVGHPGALRAMALPPTSWPWARHSCAETSRWRATSWRRWRSASGWYRLARLLLTLPATEAARRGQRHSRTRDRATVTAHYDAGNDFYALWLDRVARCVRKTLVWQQARGAYRSSRRSWWKSVRKTLPLRCTIRQ
jgi:cyclopropane-fatty-acyl-phospholipid synthase